MKTYQNCFSVTFDKDTDFYLYMIINSDRWHFFNCALAAAMRVAVPTGRCLPYEVAWDCYISMVVVTGLLKISKIHCALAMASLRACVQLMSAVLAFSSVMYVSPMIVRRINFAVALGRGRVATNSILRVLVCLLVLAISIRTKTKETNDAFNEVYEITPK